MSSQRRAHGGMASNMILARGGIKTVKTVKRLKSPLKQKDANVVYFGGNISNDSKNNVLQK